MKKILLVFVLLGLVVGLVSCKPKEHEVILDDVQIEPQDDLYRVYYEIFVGAFSDSNKDGIGDLQGVINRLDYLNDGDFSSGKSLGVTGLWMKLERLNQMHMLSVKRGLLIFKLRLIMKVLAILILVWHNPKA